MSVKHPARFSSALLPVLAEAVEGFGLVLDPFAGTGRIHDLPNMTVGVEIEPDWARMHPDTIVGDATQLPFRAASFNAVVTSPTYGNRFADHHTARDGSSRRSYTHDLGRKLAANNSGAMHWGDAYRALHVAAWREVHRVLVADGRFVLNIKDHLRNHKRQRVTAWHVATLLDVGFDIVSCQPVAVSGMRYGANRERVGHELVIAFDKASP
jgi:tRNA G10  N-methylase Trm11